MTLHLLSGIPGSGKSTIASNIPGHIVSTDKIRKFLWEDESITSRDKLVFELAESIIKYLLRRGKDVIFDATNISALKRKKYINLAKAHNAKVILHWVNVPVDIAIERNLNRQRKVPIRAIRAMYKSFQEPIIKEGLDQIKIYGKNLNLLKIVTPGVILKRL